jgi:hypothetical protein
MQLILETEIRARIVGYGGEATRHKNVVQTMDLGLRHTASVKF